MKFTTKILINITIGINLMATQAPATQAVNGYYDTTPASKGYYWYHDAKQPVVEEPEEAAAPAPSEPKPEEKVAIIEEKKQPDKKRRIPNMQDYPMEALWSMHPDDFQELLMDFQKKAVMAPTVDNVREYKVMEDVARRKSLVFANVAAFIQQTDTSLNIEKDFPTVSPGRAAALQDRYEDVMSKLSDSKDRFALLNFTGAKCRLCDEQRKINKMFTKKHKWEMSEVSKEKMPEMHARYKVSFLPTLMLIERDNPNAIPIIQGAVSMEDLERRVYRTVRTATGETTPQDFSGYASQKGGAFDPNARPETMLPHTPGTGE